MWDRQTDVSPKNYLWVCMGGRENQTKLTWSFIHHAGLVFLNKPLGNEPGSCHGGGCTQCPLARTQGPGAGSSEKLGEDADPHLRDTSCQVWVVCLPRGLLNK